ncbi:MAG: glycosyltransferase family 39 protein [Candidatus Gastranaerophilales bacterium]|nr:glycosyltransferase family 39 protein [Candidatus Gastranaerophilales bacterium]
MWDWEKSADFLYRVGNWVVRIVGGLIFLGLAWYAMRYTYYMCPGGNEMPSIERDSIWGNLLAALLALLVLAALLFAERRLDIYRQLFVCRVTVIAAMLWVGGVSAWWILSADRTPVGDQAFVYGGASYFLEGDYHFLYKGSYMGIYPHQLALVALCELLFVFVGAYNYFAIEVCCAVMAVGSVYVGYRIVSELTDHMAVIVGYNLLMFGCLPLIFYTPWCYGDIPSIFCSLTAAWMLIVYAKQGKWRYLVFMVAAVVLALLFRKHSLILLVALCIAAALYALRNKDIRIILAAVSAVILFEVSYQGIFKMYELRSDVEHVEGMPIQCWVAMGLQETEWNYYGWYNDYSKAIFAECEFDTIWARQAAELEIEERIDFLVANPDYAKLFFREKVLSQWNEPLYQALFFNSQQAYEGTYDENSLAYRIGGEYYGRVLAFCNRWQFVIFLGMLCYYLFAVRRDSNILQHVLAITIIGGFLFSIVYEAKARYIFPYYVMMFPFAVYGYQLMLEWMMRLFGSGEGRRAGSEEHFDETERTA